MMDQTQQEPDEIRVQKVAKDVMKGLVNKETCVGEPGFIHKDCGVIAVPHPFHSWEKRDGRLAN